MGDGNIVGIAINNEVNQSDKPIGFIWSVFDKASHPNSRFNALDTLTVVVHSVEMPVGFGWNGIKCKGRTLVDMTHLKKSIK